MSSPYLCPVFEGAEEPGIFSVPEPRESLGIFPSPSAYMEGERSKSYSCIFLHIFPSYFFVFPVYSFVFSTYFFILALGLLSAPPQKKNKHFYKWIKINIFLTSKKRLQFFKVYRPLRRARSQNFQSPRTYTEWEWSEFFHVPRTFTRI